MKRETEKKYVYFVFLNSFPKTERYIADLEDESMLYYLIVPLVTFLDQFLNLFKGFLVIVP